jgi:hypothetical protein
MSMGLASLGVMAEQRQKSAKKSGNTEQFPFLNTADLLGKWQLFYVKNCNF